MEYHVIGGVLNHLGQHDEELSNTLRLAFDNDRRFRDNYPGIQYIDFHSNAWDYIRGMDSEELGATVRQWIEPICAVIESGVLVSRYE